jgi:protein TonB
MAKSVGISALLHLAAIGAFTLLAASFSVKTPPPLVIDLTISSPAPADSTTKERTRAATPDAGRAKPSNAVAVPSPFRQTAAVAEAAPSPAASSVPAAPREAVAAGDRGGAPAGIAKTATPGPPRQSPEPGTTTGGSAESVKQRYLKEHFVYIRELVAKRLVYPGVARKMGWGGKVVVAFTVMEDGSATDIRLVESSGVPVLDRSGLETVRRASPFPKPPVRAEIVIPVLFSLL